MPAIGILVVLTGAAGCSGSAGPVPQARVTMVQRTVIPRDSPARPGSASASAMKSMQAAVDQAVGAVHEKGTPLFIAGAEILSDPDEAESPTIRTDSGLDVSAGSYLLVAFCAGSGRVTARLSVGKATARLTVACRMVPRTIRLRVRARRGGVETVQLAAVGRQPVAVAYELASTAGTR